MPFFVRVSGVEYGPVSADQLKDMVSNGRLDRNDEVRKTDSETWYPAHKVKSLFPADNAIVVASRPVSTFVEVPARNAGPLSRELSAPSPPIEIAVSAPAPLIASDTVVSRPLAATLEAQAGEVACPFCAETIKRDAKKCKHCGEILDVILRHAMTTPPPQVQYAPPPVVHINNVNNNVTTAVAGVHRGHLTPAWNPFLAAVLSFIIPGLGQMYKGQVLNGIAWFFFVIVGYMLFIIPGLILHLCCVLGAAMGNPYRYH